MRLSQNMYSLNIYSKYKNELQNNSSAIKNISSGLKLNKAKDNPNKIAQSESLKIQVLSNAVAKRNVEDTNSMIQTFDGGMQEMNESLLRLKELAVKSGDGTMASDDRESIQQEINALTEHIDKIAKTTEFNGVKLLNDTGSIKSATGSMAGEYTYLPKFNLTKATLGLKEGTVLGGDNINLESIDVTNPDNIGKTIDSVNNAIKTVSAARSKYGAIQLNLESTGNNIEDQNLSLQKSQSNIADADIAEEMINFSKSQILIQSSIALMSQSNNFPKDALNVLANIR